MKIWINDLSKKSLLLFLMLIPIILSGCGLRPQKIDAGKVEEIAREAINEGVHLSDQEPETEDFYDGRHYIYSFVDERGIPFTVEVISPNFSLFEFHKAAYENYVYFYTDYRNAIMSYYFNEVENIFKSVEGINFDDKDKEIIRITDELALESLEDILMKIDATYDFDYSYSGRLETKLDKKIYWKDFRPYDLLIRYNGKQGELFFSTDNDESLSADYIHEIIENLKRD